jgi:hypothetical protein
LAAKIVHKMSNRRRKENEEMKQRKRGGRNLFFGLLSVKQILVPRLAGFLKSFILTFYVHLFLKQSRVRGMVEKNTKQKRN